MKAKSYCYETKVRKKLEQYFHKSTIEQTALKEGFKRRKHKKITACNFLLSFFLMAVKGSNSYACWAQQLCLLTKKSISKQSIFERMGMSAVKMTHSLLQQRLKHEYGQINTGRLFKFFKRVLLQDSTTLHLPDSLKEYFPGNKSNGKQRSLVRIQSIFDIVSSQFCYFGLFPYTNNDQKASGIVSLVLEKGDLIIRDLGYFVIDTLQDIIESQAYFLTRITHSVCIYEDVEGEKKHLTQILKNRNFLDKWVWVSESHKMYARLVAVKLPEHIANERRRKAKHQKDKRFKYSKEYLNLLGYNFYITNVDDEVWSIQDVLKAYKVRWKIEVIFKSWKSNFKIQKLIHKQCYNLHRVQCIIYMMLLFISVFQLQLYNQAQYIMEKKYNKQLSLLKLGKFTAENFLVIISSDINKLIKILSIYCCYENRTDRTNINVLQRS